MHQFVHTTLTVKEAAQVFRETGAKFINGKAKLIGALASLNGHETNGFFTPTFENDPFADLAEKPTFTIGVARAKVGFYGARAGEQDPVHMYVTDRGDYRELQFYSPVGMLGSGPAIRHLAMFVDAVLARDPQAQAGNAM